MANSSIPNISTLIKNISNGDMSTLPDGEYMVPSSALQSVSNLPSISEGGVYVKAMSWENGYRLYMAITYYYATLYIGKKQPDVQTIVWRQI